VGVLHIINDLSRISGAESALLRVAGAQSTRPIAIASLGGLSADRRVASLSEDVEIVTIQSRLGLVGKVFELARLIRKRMPASTICWMYRSNVIGMLAWLLAGRPGALIWNVRHSLGDYQSEPLRVRFSICLNRMFSRVPRAIVYASSRALREHAAFGFSAQNALRIPNGFELSPPVDHGAPEGCGIVVGHAGRMVWEKDLRTLLTAFSLARASTDVPMSLVLVGEGYEWINDQFAFCVSDCGLGKGDLMALGRIDDMGSFYRSIDLFALSSVSEAFPNVLAEALLHGKPCVTTDVGDAAEIVDSGSGWVVPAKHVDLFSKALVEAACMSRRGLRQMGEAGRARVAERFSIADVAKQYDRLTFQ
jgi:glycosyltransferase involved in cell wall biosynthesis